MLNKLYKIPLTKYEIQSISNHYLLKENNGSICPILEKNNKLKDLILNLDKLPRNLIKEICLYSLVKNEE